MNNNLAQAVMTENENEEVSTRILSQVEAVYQLALKHTDAEHRAEKPLKELITKDVKKAMRLELLHLIKTHQVKYKKDLSDDAKLKKYCSSVINNFVKGVKPKGGFKDSRYHTVLQHPVTRK